MGVKSQRGVEVKTKQSPHSDYELHSNGCTVILCCLSLITDVLSLCRRIDVGAFLSLLF